MKIIKPNYCKNMFLSGNEQTFYSDSRTFSPRSDMVGKDLHRIAGKNRILSALPAGDGKQFLPKLQVISLSDKQVLYEQGDPIKYVYFPTTAVISLISIMEDGSSIEIAGTGPEGLVGITVFFGIEKSFAKTIVQVPGEALRIRTDAFKVDSDKIAALNALVRRYAHALLAQVVRSTGCNSLHATEQRCARWLLVMHDRSKTDELPFTQEFLGEMLGVRRPSVSVAAGKLQKAGLIRYNRGKVKVLDRRGLEKASCECYRVIRDEYERFLL
jgi:CRP-like cAMP-binding protein